MLCPLLCLSAPGLLHPDVPYTPHGWTDTECNKSVRGPLPVLNNTCSPNAVLGSPRKAVKDACTDSMRVGEQDS